MKVENIANYKPWKPKANFHTDADKVALSGLNVARSDRASLLELFRCVIKAGLVELEG